MYRKKLYFSNLLTERHPNLRAGLRLTGGPRRSGFEWVGRHEPLENKSYINILWKPTKPPVFTVFNQENLIFIRLGDVRQVKKGAVKRFWRDLDQSIHLSSLKWGKMNASYTFQIRTCWKINSISWWRHQLLWTGDCSSLWTGNTCCENTVLLLFAEFLTRALGFFIFYKIKLRKLWTDYNLVIKLASRFVCWGKMYRYGQIITLW